MGSVTAIFTAENRIHPAAEAILQEAIAQGWSDPTKLHYSSRRLAQLLSEAQESFSRSLQIPSETIHFLGEPTLGFHLGANGFATRREVYLPATSRQEVFAAISSRQTQSLPVDIQGGWVIPAGERADLLIIQTVNPETGAICPDSSHFQGDVFVDSTSDPLGKIPQNWSAALWDSVSWQGPRGLGIFALKDQARWTNPLPHSDHRVVPGGANPALVMASAIALEASITERTASLRKLQEFNTYIRSYITSEIGDVDIASPINGAPHLLSFSFLYVQAEQLVDDMEKRGFSIDSGSACISANIEASHVLAAMGRLTHGNIRLHLYPSTTLQEIDGLLNNLRDLVIDQRGSL
jgi:cysteine desulfurase